LISKILAKVLTCKKTREQIIFQIKQKYFHELSYSIPLKNGYWGHILENDAYDSFSEVFIQQAYANFIPPIRPARVLDIGANYGYFSLWLQTVFPEEEICALMIEPSTQCRRSLDYLTEQPKLKNRFHWMEGAIADPSLVKVDFYDRPYMASSVFDTSSEETSSTSKVLKTDEIIEKLPPPYDLLKCDIEGSEWDLIIHYTELICQASYLVLEWHSWHSGGGGFEQLTKKLKTLGFQILHVSETEPSIGIDGEVGLILAKNTSKVD